MYKEKEESNKAAKERMRKMRERRNTEGVTRQGVTLEGLVILSDGQKWYPLKKTKGLPGEMLQNIAQAGKIFNDTDGRMERALRYEKWIDDGRPRSKSVMLSNGAYIAVDKLVDKKWRGLLTYLVENLKPAYQDSIRVGMSGPSIRECKKLLEVTA